MAYKTADWQQNVKNRSDLTNLLTHLTKPSEEYRNPTDVLIKILNEQRLIASTEGYIVGGGKVVCFQDIPMYSLAQNVINHIEEFESNKTQTLRYYPCGIALPKAGLVRLVDPSSNQPILNSGARPVIYEKTELAKQFLPKDQHWRIVNFNLDGIYQGEKITDWTHEREWRVLGDILIPYNMVTVILRDSEQYREFISKINPDILKQLAGIICLEYLIY